MAILPKHRWKFDEQSGFIAFDSLGGVNGTLSEKVKRESQGWVETHSIHIDGSNDSFVKFGKDVGQFGTNDFTISLWFCTSEIHEIFDILGNRTAPSHGNFFCIRMVGKHRDGREGVICAEVDQDESGQNYIALGSKKNRLNDEKWHHVVVVRNGPRLKLYVDGTLNDDRSTTSGGITNIANGNEFILGRSLVDAGIDRFAPDAQFNDLRIYDCALPDDEIAYIFQELVLWDGKQSLNGKKVAFKSLKRTKQAPHYYMGSEAVGGFIGLVNYQFSEAVPVYAYLGVTDGIVYEEDHFFEVETVEKAENEYLYMGCPSNYQKCILKAANSKYVTADCTGLLVANALQKEDALIFAIDMTRTNPRLLKLNCLYKQRNEMYTPPKGIKYTGCLFTQANGYTFWNTHRSSEAADFEIYFGRIFGEKEKNVPGCPGNKSDDDVKTISLRAMANCKYVCADTDLKLIANRDNPIGPWEIFELINISNDKVALKSLKNGKYVCADTDLKLIANRDKIGPWETFELVGISNDHVALKSLKNGKYVCADINLENCLIANREKIGPWETFRVNC